MYSGRPKSKDETKPDREKQIAAVQREKLHKYISLSQKLIYELKKR